MADDEGKYDQNENAIAEPSFELELRQLLNKHSRENASNTPDFILAQFLLSALAAYDAAVLQRENWYGIGLGPSDQKEPGQPVEPVLRGYEQKALKPEEEIDSEEFIQKALEEPKP